MSDKKILGVLTLIIVYTLSEVYINNNCMQKTKIHYKKNVQLQMTITQVSDATVLIYLLKEINVRK